MVSERYHIDTGHCAGTNNDMPVRNTIRFDISESFYHVYNRGVNRQLIFRNGVDKAFFLKLLARYLGNEITTDAYGNVHKTFNDKLELVCFCLMDNHFHLLFYQIDQGALRGFMQSLANSYIHYFNKKYERSGPLFESRYKSSLVETPSYLEHISRYIHLNPKNWRTHSYSSLPFYLGSKRPQWLKPQRMLDNFKGTDYLKFMEDYEDHKAMLDEIKHELAT